MLHTRISTPGDIPRQRELWQLAFGDSGAYVDNFYRTYYKPERMLMLEEDGVIQAMTAWFDTSFVVPGQENQPSSLSVRRGHPPRGPGPGGWPGSSWRTRIICFRPGAFRRSLPSRQNPLCTAFSGKNGFRECFVHGAFSCHPENSAAAPCAPVGLEPLTPMAYTALREERLTGTSHITIPAEMGRLSGGSLCPHARGADCTRWPPPTPEPPCVPREWKTDSCCSKSSCVTRRI